MTRLQMIRFRSLRRCMPTKTGCRPNGGRAGRHQSPATARTPPSIPQDVAEFIGGRPTVQGEDPRQYDALFDKLAKFIAPEDPIEWIWTKDIIDAHWEARRARRMRDQILDLGRYKAMRRVAENLLQDKRCTRDFDKLVTDTVASWMGPDGEARLAEFLAAHDLDKTAIAAEVFMARAQPYDQLERMAAAADKRRDAVFREIERRRAWRAQLFEEGAKILDAEAEDVTGKEPAAPVVRLNDKR